MKEYAKEFYQSAAWKRARRQVITRACGLCERCKAQGIYKPGYIVHHKDYITPGNINNPRITLDISNLEYVCEDCHNKEHKAKHNNRYGFDADGNIIPPRETSEGRADPPGAAKQSRGKEPRELPQKNSARSRTHEGGLGMEKEQERKAGEGKEIKAKATKKRPNKLTNARIKKEIGFLEKMFAGIDDENKKTLINSLIEEAAFLKIACYQAKEELKKEGLTTETVNASQKFVKAHPSATIYEKYSRQYTQIIHSLIEYLPPKEKEKVDRLAALRDA